MSSESKARSLRLATVWISLLVLAVAVAVWAAYEAREERRDVERALKREVAILARSLGPALSAASTARRELEEIVGWKLLDNARLVARLDAAGRLDGRPLDMIRVGHGLETVAFLDAAGAVSRASGAALPEALFTPALGALARGELDEAVLEWPAGASGPPIMAAAASHPSGGAVVVTASSSQALAFARRLGVENVLAEIVETGSVLYLLYREGEDGFERWATWDGGPPPSEHPEQSGVVQVRDREVFEVEVPLRGIGGGRGLLCVGLDAAPLERASDAATRRSVLVGTTLAICGILATGIGFVERARAREHAEAERRLAELEAKRRQSERLAAAGALTAGLAHEIRNPLNAISMAAQRLERRPELSDASRGFATTVRDEVGRLEGILRDFLDLARPSRAAPDPVDVRDLVREVAALVAIEASARDIAIEAAEEADGTAVATVDAEAVRRATLNLFRNAVQASPDGAVVEWCVVRDDDRISVRVADRGVGISNEDRERLFDAFVTSRAEGTGLGLAIVRRVAEEHEGTARLEPRDGGGTLARLDLPASFGPKEERG